MNNQDPFKKKSVPIVYIKKKVFYDMFYNIGNKLATNNQL